MLLSAAPAAERTSRSQLCWASTRAVRGPSVNVSVPATLVPSAAAGCIDEFSPGVRDVRLLRPACELPDFHATTSTFIETAAFRNGKGFITSNDLVDPMVFVLLDAPGMGKTVTVEAAAEFSDAIYGRFLASCGIMSSAQTQLKRDLTAYAQQHGGLVQPHVAEELGIRTWTIALAACMDRIREQVLLGKRMIGQMEVDDVDFSIGTRSAQQLVSDAQRALLDAVAAAGARRGRVAAAATGAGAAAASGAVRSEKVPVVLHFDEIQALLPQADEPEVYKRLPVSERSPPAPSPPEVCMRYSFVWFSFALLQTYPGFWLKPFITGIGADTSSSLRFRWGFNKWATEPLPHFTPLMSKRLLERHLRFENPADADLVAAGVSGCPRAAQHLLCAVKARVTTLSAGLPLRSLSCSELLTVAYDSWRKAGSGASLKGEVKHMPAVQQALLAVAHPVACDPAASDRAGVRVAVLPVSKVPASWREAADAGLIRLRIEGGTATVFPPYPFLQRYLRSLHAPSREAAAPDPIGLVAAMQMQMLPQAEVSGASSRGNGKAFETAVAHELSFPGSPLLQSILQSPQLQPLGLAPFSRDVTVPQMLPSGSSKLGAVRNNVLVLEDASGDGAAKPADIAVPVLAPLPPTIGSTAGKPVPAWLLVQVNTSVAVKDVRSGLSAFVKRMEACPEARFGCYLTTLGPGGAGSRRLACMAQLDGFNANGKAEGLSGPRRALGVLVPSQLLLEFCTLPLHIFARAEGTGASGAATMDTSWVAAAVAVFPDAVAMQTAAKELHALAASLPTPY